MPARVALALQADGWWLRSEVVWHKPNPMPESCTDRPTSSHEKLYLLSKRATYFYDAEAVRVPAPVPVEQARTGPRRAIPGTTWNLGRTRRGATTTDYRPEAAAPTFGTSGPSPRTASPTPTSLRSRRRWSSRASVRARPSAGSARSAGRRGCGRRTRRTRTPATARRTVRGQSRTVPLPPGSLSVWRLRSALKPPAGARPASARLRPGYRSPPQCSTLSAALAPSPS